MRSEDISGVAAEVGDECRGYLDAISKVRVRESCSGLTGGIFDIFGHFWSFSPISSILGS